MSITDEADNDTTGAIDTSDDQPSPPISTDNSQGQPPAQGQNSAPNQLPDVGPPPAMSELATETTGQFGSDIGEGLKRDVAQGVQNVQQSGPGQLAKRVIAYLGGEGGNPAGALRGAAAVKQVAPHLSDGDAALISIDNTAKTKGIQAAFDELQGHRVAYNAKLAFAKVAAEGIGGKPANIASAVDAANKAMMHMPDGANVHFQAGQGGVTATVKMPGTSQVHQIPLSIDQFKQFLDVGGAGQWDRVHGQGTPVALQSLARSQGVQPRAGADQQTMPGQSDYSQDDDEAPQQARPRQQAPRGPSPKTATAHDVTDDAAFGPVPGRLAEAPETNYGPELEARAKSMFGMAHNQESEGWKAAQEEKELERQSKLDVANQQGINSVNAARARNEGLEAVAKTRAGAYMYGADQRGQALKDKAMQALAVQQRIAQSTHERNAASLLRQKLANEAITPLTPEEQSQVQRMTRIGMPQVAAPQAPTPTGQARPQATGSPQDQQARAWAQANPNDPRAAQIMQRLGAQ